MIGQLQTIKTRSTCYKMVVRSSTIGSEAYITGISRLTSNATIQGTTRVLLSDALVSDPKTTIVCDGDIFDELVEDFGAEVVLRVVSKTRDPDDNYAQASESYTDHKVNALVQRFTSTDEDVKEGVFKAGELVFTFSMIDEAHVNTGNRVRYGNTWYEIREVIQQPLAGNNYLLQGRVQKI